MTEDELELRRDRFRQRLIRELGLRPSQTAEFVWHLINDRNVPVNVDLEGLTTDEHFEKYFRDIKKQIEW